MADEWRREGYIRGIARIRAGETPYVSSDDLFRGKLDPRRPPKERVVGIKVGEVARAYPWPVLAERRVVHDRLGDQELVILYQPGTLSALDASEIQRSRAVGATSAFLRVLEGRGLTFDAVDRALSRTWFLLLAFGIAMTSG